jgi:hypothetical protein
VQDFCRYAVEGEQACLKGRSSQVYIICKKLYSMKYWRVLFIFAVLVAALLAAGCIESDPVVQEPSASAAGASERTPEEMVAFVMRAYEYANIHGKEAALREFNNQSGSFSDPDLYVFAYDFNGTILALPYEPALIGTDRLNVTDSEGTAYIRDAIEAAESGGGFIRYVYPNPKDDFRPAQKISYVMMVDDSWFLGSGIYADEDDLAAAGWIEESISVREEIVPFVDRAVEFAQTHGRDAALAEFMNLNGTFIEGELYIYAFDFNGTCLALPHQPQLVGTDLRYLQDAYGVNFTVVEIYLAEQGSGFLFYHYPNPEMNYTVMQKTSYVKKVDDTWWLGAGKYLSGNVSSRGAAAQEAMLSSIKSRVSLELAAIDANVSDAARHFARAGMEGTATTGVLEYVVNSSPYIEDAVIVGLDGRILAVAPEKYRDAVGSDISGQSHIQQVFASRRPVLSEVFTTVEGFDAAAMVYPVIAPDGEMTGAVSVPFSSEALLGDAIRSAMEEYPFTAFAIQPDGRLLYDLDPDEIGKMTLEDPIYQSYPDLLALARRMVTEESGSGEYTFFATGTKEKVVKVSIWDTVALHGTEWRIIVTREP